jgi:hypothetical protein
MIERASALARPNYGHRVAETMPADDRLFCYDCRGCGTTLRSKAGDGCGLACCG